MKKIIAFIRDRNAAAAVEYAVLLMGIAIVIIVSVTALGQAVLALFQPVVAAF